MAAPSYPVAPHPSPLRALLGWPLVLAVLAAGAIATTWLASGAVLDAFERGGDWLAAHDGVSLRAAVTAALAALVLFVCAVAMLRAASERRAVRLAEGDASIEVGDLAEWLGDALAMRHDVREADVRVENRLRRGVKVSAVLQVMPHARLAETTVGAHEAIEALLRSQVGVPLAGPPALQVRYQELRLRPAPPSDDAHAA